MAKGEVERLTAVIMEEIRLLRRWADESVQGGWSTHQVVPMRDRANALALLLCGVETPGASDGE